MRRLLLTSAILATLCCGAAHAQYAPAAPPASGLLGYWSTETGSVLRVERCDTHVCITVVTISKKAPGVLDALNPDASLRSRPVCQMVIGSGFDLEDANHAVNGKIYDPESGKTYRSVMTSEGNALHLRGYIGIRMFGRTETWQRTTAQYATCRGTTQR
jgi:uncharacterized protein (DUF2147 family)